MYIFGGWNGRTYFNDTMSFDLERMVWKKLDTVGKINLLIVLLILFYFFKERRLCQDKDTVHAS